MLNKHMRKYKKAAKKVKKFEDTSTKNYSLEEENKWKRK